MAEKSESLKGYVKETVFVEDGKKFELWHDPINGTYKKKEAPIKQEIDE